LGNLELPESTPIQAQPGRRHQGPSSLFATALVTAGRARQRPRPHWLPQPCARPSPGAGPATPWSSLRTEETRSRFRPRAHRTLLDAARLWGSRGTVASAGDNAAMEFWIEDTAERRRRQRGLGPLTPVEFELAFSQRAEQASRCQKRGQPNSGQTQAASARDARRTGIRTSTGPWPLSRAEHRGLQSGRRRQMLHPGRSRPDP